MRLTQLLQKILLTGCLLVLVQWALAQAPVAQFTADKTSGCGRLGVQFTDQSTNSPTSWLWNFGNGITSTLRNPFITYAAPGTYTVTLTATNASGTNTVTRSNYITVLAEPIVAFASGDTIGCAPKLSQFTDLSQPGGGTITSRAWDFGDGQNANTQNPSNIYRNSGNFTVSLIVTNSLGCQASLTKPNYVRLTPGVTINFTPSATAACNVPANFNFANTSVENGNTVSYTWRYGNGDSSLGRNGSYTYRQTGDYDVTLIARSQLGCVDSVVRPKLIKVGSVATRIIGPDTVCINTFTRFVFESDGNPSSSLWNNGAGQLVPNSTFADLIYGNPGTYTISLIVNLGNCVDTIRKTVQVFPAAVPRYIQSDTASCAIPFTLRFTNQSTNAVRYLWEFSDGTTSTEVNPTKTFTNFQQHFAQLYAFNAQGCRSGPFNTGFINVLPIQFNVPQLPLNGCLPVAFNPRPNIASVIAIDKYEWDFGDGTTSTQRNPSKTYTTPGNFDVKFTVTSRTGCVATFTYRALAGEGVRVGNKPTASFTPPPASVCVGQNIQFNSTSTGPTPLTFFWNFGDGKTTAEQNPVFAYSDTGTYTVKHYVGHFGCIDSAIRVNTVKVIPPQAKFDAIVDCNNRNRITFVNRSINAATYNWNFGNGQTSTVANPGTIVYGSNPTYNVSLTVTSAIPGNTCTHTLLKTITISNADATLRANKTTICKRDTVTFSQNTVERNNIVLYRWGSGDGFVFNTRDSIQFRYRYTQSGTYNAYLVITDVNGCTDSSAVTIRVQGPTAAIDTNFKRSCAETISTFANISTTSFGNAITRYTWYFGDGNSSNFTNTPFTHTYGNQGVYFQQLKVTDAVGCTDSIASPVPLTVGLAKADYFIEDSASCLNRDVLFTSRSRGSNLQHNWTIGDGTTYNVPQFIKQFNRIGSYDVKLVVRDAIGCIDSLSKINFIRIDTPTARFIVSDSVTNCPPLPVNFTFQGSYQRSVRWDFGTGGFSTLLNPTHNYLFPGDYKAVLTVTSPGGCVATATRDIKIGGPKGSFLYAATKGCDSVVTTFTATNSSNLKVIWDFGDGNINNANTQTAQHIYRQAGRYVPFYILTDTVENCTVAYPGKDTIIVSVLTPGFKVDTGFVCQQGTFRFTDTSLTNTRISGYEWYWGDGQFTLNEANPSHFYANPGVFGVTMVAYTPEGCRKVAAVPNLIRVAPNPIVSIAVDTFSLCQFDSIQYRTQINQPDTSQLRRFEWDFGNGVRTTVFRDPPPRVWYSTTGNFTASLIVTNSLGCKDTTSRALLAKPAPPLDAGRDSTYCLGQPVTLRATGADSAYLWLEPNFFLACKTCGTTPSFFSDTRLFKVRGTGKNGCSTEDSVLITIVQPTQVRIIPDSAALCEGQSVVLQAVGANSYSWSPAAGLSATTGDSVIARPTTTTAYVATATDNRNCFISRDTVQVRIVPFPVIELGPDQTIPVGTSLLLTPQTATNVSRYVWSSVPAGVISNPSAPAPFAKPTDSTLIILQAFNELGCSRSDSMRIFVLCGGDNLYMPNTFSPNGDGNNDRFYPMGRGLDQVIALRIYDRWGGLIYERRNFQANNRNEGWDGNINGKPAQAGVYVYIVEVACTNNTPVTFKGNIALIR